MTVGKDQHNKYHLGSDVDDMTIAVMLSYLKANGARRL